MGLSSEERFSKSFASLAGLRRALLVLHAEVRGEDKAETSQTRIVLAWVEAVDRIAGLVVEKLNTTSTYWLLGRSRTNVESLYSHTYSLGRVNYEMKSGTEPGTLGYVYFGHNGTGLLETARFWTNQSAGFTDDPGVRVLAAFWEAFAWLDALLYAVNRYDDGLFPEHQKDAIRRLFGEMLLRRFALVTGYYETDPHDVAEWHQVEQVLLCRHRLLMAEIDEATTAASNKLRELREKKDRVTKSPWDEPFDLRALKERIGKLPVRALRKALEGKEQAKWEEEASRRPESNEPLYSMFPRPRPARELEEIVNTSMDRKAVDEAAEELSCHYGTYMTPDYGRFEKVERKEKPKRKKRKRG